MRADPNYRGNTEFSARTLARLMAQAFDSDTENAKRIIEGLETRMSAAIASHLRMKYVLANACVMIALVVALLCVLFALPHVSGLAGFPFTEANVEKYAKLSILGALGAFLSVSIGIRKIQVERTVRPLEHIWTGGARIVIGVIGAMFLGLALDAKLLAPGFGAEPTLWVFYLLAFLAGFSESIVPNTLRKTEQFMAEQGVAAPAATQAH